VILKEREEIGEVNGGSGCLSVREMKRWSLAGRSAL